MENFELQCEREYADNVSDYRAINRFVWYQIRQMVDDDKKLGRILKVNSYGILEVNYNTRLLTEEQKNYISRLIANERDGIYLLHRFEDLKKKAKNLSEYNKWFDEKAMNSFMQTVPTKQVFYSEPRNLYYKLKERHSHNELNREDFSGYSIWQTIYALDIIDPFLVGILLGGKIEIEKHNWDTYIKFDYKGETLYGKSGRIDLYKKDENNKFVKLDDTIHTLLFRHYREPIYKTLNSIMYPIGGYRVMPSEGLFDDPKIPQLTSDTQEILKSKNYQILAEEYDLGRSRVSSRY